MITAAQSKTSYKGNDRLLFGIIMGVVAFWLFAQTTLNIAPDMGRDLGMDVSMMNIAVAITSLFSGIFIVVMGGLADRVGRVRVTRIGFYLSIAGSLLVAATPQGWVAVPVMLLGRALQGLSAACIMPASLALLKAFWDGAERQRAISMWSIGSWGGSGLCSLVGGLMSQSFGWRSVFWVAIAVSALGLWMMRGTPESRAETSGDYRFDLSGVAAFMVTMVALQVLVTQGNKLGWASRTGLALLATTALFGVALFPHREQGVQCVLRLQPVQQLDLHRRDDFQLPDQRDRRNVDRVAATGAARRKHERPAGRLPDAGLRDRHHRLHPRRREIAATLWSA